MSLRVEWQGVKEFQSGVRRAPKALRATLNREMEASARSINLQARRRVHVVSGRLRASIRVRRRTEFDWTVTAGTRYAAIEEARIGGRHPGPHAYLRPSVTNESAKLRSRLPRNILQALRRGFR